MRLIGGDCREVLATLPADSVHCVVTSPPYYALRDYGVAGQIGLEATPDAYLAEMVRVFREVKRVLRPDGTVWCNMGDSYCSTAPGTMGDALNQRGILSGVSDRRAEGSRKFRPETPKGFKPKDLLMMPARLALALQADGWWLRSDIIWHKPNPMPESVTDRPTSAHEHVFLLAKSARYFYDADAVREVSISDHPSGNGYKRDARLSYTDKNGARGNDEHWQMQTNRNCRNVWTIATAPYSEAHFATFPPALAERCIRAGTSERGCCAACGAPWRRQTQGAFVPTQNPAFPKAGQKGVDASNGWGDVPRGRTETTTTGWAPSCRCSKTPHAASTPPGSEDQERPIGDVTVSTRESRVDRRLGAPVPCTVLDPFAGAGTTLLVADRLQRDAIGIELNPAYTEMAMARCRDDAPLFASPPPAEPLDLEEPRIRDLFA